MSAAKHSALPWRIEKDGSDTHVRDANGHSLACDMSYYPWTFDVDDVELIVRAVNSHADMLEALEAIVAEADQSNGGKGAKLPIVLYMKELAQAAIAKAKGAA